MKKTRISENWYFKKPSDEAYRVVDLPHDYMITSARDARAYGGDGNAYYANQVGTYVKYFTAEDTHTILDIDGAYMCTTVDLNGDRLGMHPHGYAPYLVDMTAKLQPGRPNKLVLTTHPIQNSARWYSGAGVYRDVFLWTGGKTRIEPWDLFITTESIEGGRAVLHIKADVASDEDAKADLCFTVRDETGAEAAAKTVSLSVRKGEKTAAALTLEVEAPLLWTLDEPHLYTLLTTVSVGGKVTDTAENTFGIRTMTCDVEHGFRLNGVEMKLRGGCIHHDHGALGAASFPAAEERKVRLLKQAGFNSFRIAHNPPSLALLEACDRLGVVVMDEAFDMWNVQKRPYDYSLWFADWWERDITAMVMRDRNHPCVLTYSIGNEIIERDGSSDGAEWAEKLACAIRKVDDTRYVTSGICGMWDRKDPMDPPDYTPNCRVGYQDGERSDAGIEWDKRTFGFMKPLDIVGYNYLYSRYDMDHERYPDRVIWGSETHALRFFDSWSVIMRSPYVLGDYTWTAIDNLGECGAGRMMWAREGYLPGIVMQPYPWRTCFQGDLDLAGFRRPQSYFRENVWIGGKAPYLVTTHPEHTGESYSGTGWHWYDVHDSWTFEEQYIGCPVKVDCYTDADLVKFYLNNIKVGEARPEKAIASVTVPYEKGTLTAVAYKTGERRPVGRAALHTVGAAARLLVQAEKETVKADYRDLAYFDITVADRRGERVPTAGNEIRCKVTGGELLAVFSGEPANEDVYGSDTCHVFEGRAVAVVRTRTPGEVTVTVYGESLAGGSAAVKAE